MDFYRKTYVKVSLKNIKENIRAVKDKFAGYDYYFGVVKADCYSHGYKETVGAVIEAGCNYLAVATLDEAIEIRSIYKEIPILCLGVIDIENLEVAKINNITITIPTLDYLKRLNIEDLDGLNFHVKINTGMNRLGISSKAEFEEVCKIIKNYNLKPEGIYTHIYNAECRDDYNNQIEKFKKITEGSDLSMFKIRHIPASEATINYPKLDFVNGCRLGIIMYGFCSNKDLNLKSTYCLKSKVVQINSLNAGDTVGYNGAYKASQSEKIAVVAIGYADGIIRKNTGRYVYINDKKYTIVGNICMDMMFVKVDESVKVNDEVDVLKDNCHIEYTSNYLETIPYEVICSVGKRVPRVYEN